MCRSRRELSNEYLLGKFGFNTAENELLQVLFNILQYHSIVSLVAPEVNLRVRAAGREAQALLALEQLHAPLSFSFFVSLAMRAGALQDLDSLCLVQQSKFPLPSRRTRSPL